MDNAVEKRRARFIEGLKKRGFTKHEIAPIVGNAFHESAGFNPKAKGDGGTAVGFLQWRLDRRKRLQELAKSKGTTETDFDTQLDFIEKEARNKSYGEKNNYEMAFAGKNTKERTLLFAEMVEKPHHSHLKPNSHSMKERTREAVRTTSDEFKDTKARGNLLFGSPEALNTIRKQANDRFNADAMKMRNSSYVPLDFENQSKQIMSKEVSPKKVDMSFKSVPSDSFISGVGTGTMDSMVKRADSNFERSKLEDKMRVSQNPQGIMDAAASDFTPSKRENNMEIPELLKRRREGIKPQSMFETIQDEDQLADAMEIGGVKAAEASAKLEQNKDRTNINTAVDKAVKGNVINSYQGEMTKQEFKDNTKAPIEAITRNAQNAADNKKGSVKDAFVESLSFFLPQLLGMGVGALIGGAEGAVEGGEQAGKLSGAFLDYKLKKQELEKSSQMKQKAMQQSGFVDSKTGVPAIFDPNSGQYVDPSGNVIPSNRIREAVQGRFEAKEAKLSDVQQEQLRAFNDVNASLDRISKLKPKVNTGVAALPYQSGLEKIGMSSKDFTALKTEVKSVSNNYIKAITGAQMSEPEAERLMAVIPQMDDDDNVFNTKLATFREIISGNKQAFAESIRTGQPLKRETIDNILKKVDTVVGNKSGTIRRKTKDGKIAIFDSNKKFLRYE